MEVAQGEKTMTFTSPLTGRISMQNKEILEARTSLSSDPYFAGWILEIIPEHIGEEIKSLSLAEQVEQWLKNEISRFRDFIAHQQTQLAYAHNGITMFDGGIPINGVLQNADKKIWSEFEQQFLATEPKNEIVQ